MFLCLLILSNSLVCFHVLGKSATSSALKSSGLLKERSYSALLCGVPRSLEPRASGVFPMCTLLLWHLPSVQLSAMAVFACCRQGLVTVLLLGGSAGKRGGGICSASKVHTSPLQEETCCCLGKLPGPGWRVWVHSWGTLLPSQVESVALHWFPQVSMYLAGRWRREMVPTSSFVLGEVYQKTPCPSSKHSEISK